MRVTKGLYGVGAALAAVLLLAMPGSAAAVRGELLVAPPLTVAGETTLEEASPILVIENLSTPTDLRILANRSVVAQSSVRYARTTESVPVDFEQRMGAPEDHVGLFSAVEIRLTRLGPGAHVVLYPLSETAGYNLTYASGATVSLDTVPATTLRSYDRTLGYDPRGRPYEFQYELESPTLVSTLGHGEATVAGDFAVYIWDADFVVFSDEGAVTYETGPHRTNETAASYFVDYRWAEISLRGGRASFVTPAHGAVAYSPAAMVHTRGTASVASARGTFETDFHRYAADGKPLALIGALGLHLQRGEGVAEDARSTEEGTVIRLGLSGELDRTSILGAPKPGPLETSAFLSAPAGFAAIVVGAPLLLALGAAVAYRSYAERTRARLMASVTTAGDAAGEAVDRLEALAYRHLSSKVPIVPMLLALRPLTTLIQAHPPTDHLRFRLARAETYLRLGLARLALRDYALVKRLEPTRDDVAYGLAQAKARIWCLTNGARRAADAAALAELRLAISRDRALRARAYRDPAFRRLRSSLEFLNAIS